MLVGLAAAGVAQPVLDLYGRNPEVFVANRSTAGQIVVFGLLVVLGVPAVWFVLLAVAENVDRRVGDVVYLALVTVLAVAAGLVISRQVLPDNTALALGLASVITGAVVAFHRQNWVESGFQYFSLLGPVALVSFLAISPTSRLIWGEEAAVVSSTIVGKPAPLVVIVLDEFPLASLMTPEGYINADLFPNFARLGDSSHWYRNAMSNSIATTQSLPAILTGRLGDKEDSPSSVDHPDNLFTLLGEAYDMHVVEWLTDLCPADACADFAGQAPGRFTSLLQDVGVVYGHLALPQAAREGLPALDGSWKGFLGQDGATAAPVDVGDLPVPPAGRRSNWIDWIERVIDEVHPDAPPTLHFAHLEAPHIPWRINPSGSHYGRPEEYTEVDGVETGGYWVNRPDLARLGFQRHLYQLGFVDQRIGDLIERLEETGTWDEAMVVVIADHGASFVAGDHRRWPTPTNLDDLYRIPLFVKLPGQPGGEVHDEPAFAIDVVPTIVDVLDIETDWTFDGRSLMTIEGTERPHTFVHWCCTNEAADTDIARLFDQVRRNHEWVPDQSSWLGVASVGEHGALVGQPVGELAPQPSDAMKWSIDQVELLVDVDRGSGFVPTLITGRVELPAGVDTDELLLAVNGTIAGAGFVIRDSATSGTLRGLLAEELVRDGENTLTILAPEPGGSGWLTGVAAEIGPIYVADDGHELAIRPEDDRRLEVDQIRLTTSGWMVTGWAADIGSKRPADRIYVFAGEKLVAFGAPNRDNANVVRWHSSEALLRSGFEFEIPVDEVPAGLARFTVVAELGGYAIESPATLTG